MNTYVYSCSELLLYIHMENQDHDINLDRFIKEEKRFQKDLEEIDVDKNWNRFLLAAERVSKRNQTHTHIGRYRYVFRFAASVVLLVAVSASVYLATLDSPHQIVRVSAGPQNLDLELNDGTVIILNKEAVISYPEKLNRRMREVSLSGEAYFEVVHTGRSPFCVHIEKHMVKVLGTSFNIKEEQTGNIEISVKEGIVSFFRKDMEEAAVRITAGQKCIYQAASEKITIDTVRSDNQFFWKTGKLYYKDAPLHEVFAELEPLFGQKIAVSDSLILTNRWNSTHVGQDLAGILDELCLYFDLYYIEKDDTIHVLRKK